MARVRIILVAGAVLIGALWSGLWYGGSHLAAGVMDKSAAAAGAGRAGADCGERAIAGFPLSFSVACTRTIIVAPGVRAEVAGFSASAPLYLPGRVDAVLASPANLDAPKQGLTAEARFASATGSANLWVNGASRVAGAVEHLDLSMGGKQALPFKSAALGRGNAEIVASAKSPNSLDVNVSLSDLDLVRTAGAALPRIGVKGRATLLGSGASLRQDGAAQLFEWLAAGGKLNLDGVELSAGQTVVGASGDLTVSSVGVVSGKLRLQLIGLAGIPDLLEQVAPGSRNKAAQATAMLTALTRLVQTEKGPAQQVDVTISDGVMMVGILPIAVIPPLF